MASHLRLLDVVTVVNPVHGTIVNAGEIGTIVEQLGPDAFEVEFLDRNGNTRFVLPFWGEDLVFLFQDRLEIK